MYPKNAASPEKIAIGAVVKISDGAVQTSGCTVRIITSGDAEGDGGGTTAYSTDGIVLYTPTQAESNHASFILIAKKTDCIPASVTVVPTLSATAGEAVCASTQKVDVETIKTKAIVCDAGVTVNVNVGTTQPVNFTGTAASALVKSDMVDVAGAAVNTANAQIGANVVTQANIDFGALQKDSITAAVPTAAANADAVWDEASTGHTDAGKAGTQIWTDIDAILDDTGTNGVLIASGTATGKLNITSGVVAASLGTGAITAATFAANAITSTVVADNTITAAKINADAITSAKIADNAIAAEHLAAGAIDFATFAADCVSGTALKAHVVTLESGAYMAIANAVMDAEYETGINMKEFLRLAGSVLFGDSEVAAGTWTFMSPNGSVSRVTVTWDGSNQRSITIDTSNET